MANKKNSYHKQALKKSLSGTAATGKGEKAKDAAVELGKDIVVGVIGGGVAGALLGRLSFFVGAAVTGVGHFVKSRVTSVLGMGMMASGTFQSMQGVNGGSKTELEGVKDRLLILKDDMKRRIFLDKVLKSKEGKKTDEKATNGLGQVQYFSYPNAEESIGDLDMSALDKIQQKIANSAAKYSEVDSVSGNEMGEYESSEMGEIEPKDTLY